MRGKFIKSDDNVNKITIFLFCSRKRALSHIARASERYFSDDPKVVADIEELELEYLFK